MKRRQFLRASTAAGCFVPSVFSAACQANLSADPGTSQSEGGGNSFPLDDLPITELQRKLAQGIFTSRQLVEMYLRKISEIDQNGIKLNSVIEINPEALAIADGLDRERTTGVLRGRLHGIPFLVKDNIDTGDRMMTTAGSLALAGHIAAHDAPIVRQLREAGAVLIGKTNLSEWANFRSSRSSSGWSSRGGQTKNPYVLRRNPCGSSAGSGVAVSASLCGFAIGTETNGSILCPSSINGIVGLKPTVGLLSRSGIIPISKSQDTAGPMTRTVHEAALVLSAMTATDVNDEATLRRPPGLPNDYTTFLAPDALNGKRIGIERSFLKVHEGVDALLARALDQMRDKGATIVEVDFKAKLKDADDNEYKLLKYEFKDGLNHYLAGANAQVGSLKDIIAFNNAHAESVMPFFKQEILEESEALGDLQTAEYRDVLQVVQNISRRAIDSVLTEHKLSAICGPATGAAWCTDVVNGDAFTGYGMGSGAAMAGYPSISVPLGSVHGLPVGLAFVNSAYGEGELLSLAYAYEQASLNRRPPTYRESIL
jgi:amidase